MTKLQLYDVEWVPLRIGQTVTLLEWREGAGSFHPRAVAMIGRRCEIVDIGSGMVWLADAPGRSPRLFHPYQVRVRELGLQGLVERYRKEAAHG